MNTRPILIIRFAPVGILACALLALGAEPESKALPRPELDGGQPLMRALAERKTTREFSPERLPDRALSNLLWAAWGINRPESGKRTAPSAKNGQEVDLYVLTSEGASLYEAEGHQLTQVRAEDIRERTGGQEFVWTAPVTLLYVADFTKSMDVSEEEKIFYAAITAGCLIQNVYLFCASEGLGTVVRVMGNVAELAETLGLGENHRILMAQTVGFPATISP